MSIYRMGIYFCVQIFVYIFLCTECLHICLQFVYFFGEYSMDGLLHSYIFGDNDYNHFVHLDKIRYQYPQKYTGNIYDPETNTMHKLVIGNFLHRVKKEYKSCGGKCFGFEHGYIWVRTQGNCFIYSKGLNCRPVYVYPNESYKIIKELERSYTLAFDDSKAGKTYDRQSK